jgi:hypothetical protein
MKEFSKKYDKINIISECIITLKKNGYDLWYTIDYIFNIIYKEYEIIGLQDAEVIGNKKIYCQKLNNKLGFMCYILSVNGYITNTNIYKNFNI